MPYVGYLSGGLAPMEMEEDKKDFNLMSKRFKSNQSIKQFSKNEDTLKKKKKIDENEDEADLDEMLKNMGPSNERSIRLRNITFENLVGDVKKQRKKEKLISWRDRELFVDKSRAVGVTMGETDNKKALDQRKKQLLKEKRKYGLAEEEETQLSWESYYSKVFNTFVFLQIFYQGSSIHYLMKACHYGKFKNFEAGMKAIDQALGSLMRDKIEQSPFFDPKGIPKCLLLRSQLMLIGNEPRLALEDLKEVMAEEPESIPGYCIKAKCMFMIADFEKSLVFWHKAKKLRERNKEVKEAIENIGQTIISSMEGCFDSKDTDDIIRTMIDQHGSVDGYLDSIKDHKEVLSDPNKHLSAAEIRLGKGQEIKILTKKEDKHERILLGDLYTDKEFLRSIFTRFDADYLKEISEESFLFLTGRSEFWRNQKPIYVTMGEKNNKKLKHKK